MKHVITHDPPTRTARSIIALLLKTAALAILLTAIRPFPAFSQQIAARTLELSSFGRYTDFAPATNFQSGVGGGVRLGYFFHRRWELEGGVGITRVDRIAGPGTENVVPLLLDVTYNYPVGWYHLLLGGGAVYNDYGSSHAWGTTLSAGVRLAFGSVAAFRVDGTREYMNRSDEVVRHSNWGLRLGLSWMLPKRSMIDETIRFGRAESAMMDSVRMPSLRVSDPVAIVGLEIERAQRDWVSRQDLIRTERSDTMSTTIHFDVGSSDIRADAIAPLEATLDLLRAVPGLRIRIEGQPDVRGSTADNITLGWQRATAAKLWLTNRGIPADRIQTIGFGEGRPLCDSNHESCKWQNRDEFVIIAGADADLRGRQ